MAHTFLITGGAGFIGSHLTERLLGEGNTVIAVDDFNDFYNPLFKHNNIEKARTNSLYTLLEADIRNKQEIHDIIQTHRPDYVVHLAARAGVRPSLDQPILYAETNILGTLNILEAIKEHPVKQLVFASSSSVYGNNKKIPFHESDKIEEQVSPYAATKRSGELLCRMYAQLYAIPITALRFFTVYGPRQRPDLAIRKFMTKIMNDEPIEVYGEGDSSRDYTYIEDIIEGIYQSIQKPFPFEVINLGNSHPVKLLELINHIENTVGKKAHIIKKPFQVGDVERTYADITKAQALLGWKPQTSITDGLRKMYDWMKSI